MANVLVVDDEPAIRRVESRWVELAGHRVVAAASGEEALEILKDESIDLALLDVRMPGMSGLSLAKVLQQQYPRTAIVMATGVGEVGAAVEAMHAGAVDYVLKPFQRQDLMEALERGLARWREKQSAAQLEAAVRGRSAELSRSLAELEVTSNTSVNAFMTIIALTDPMVAEHCRRVATLSVRIARSLGIENGALVSLERAALLHDVGKVAVSGVVLAKQGPLSADEEDLVRRHPDFGYDIVKEIPFLTQAADVIRAHQECFDGSGYPRGLAGDDIPLGARIVAVADAFDAMVHDRPYRSALGSAAAIQEIRRCSGSQFDPAVVSAFADAVAD